MDDDFPLDQFPVRRTLPQIIAKSQLLDRKLAIAIQEGKRMSTLGKIDEVIARREALNKKIDEKAQQLLDRYTESDRKFDNAVGKHEDRLNAENKKSEDLDAAIERLSNLDQGNLQGS